MNLFAYGTLQVPLVMERVVGCRVAPPEPAVLQNYRRFLIRGKTYPGIVESPGDAVQGMLFRGLGPDLVHRLDTFEDPVYERRPVRVLSGAEAVSADAYVIPAGSRHFLATADWSLERFLEHDLDRFLETHGGWTEDSV